MKYKDNEIKGFIPQREPFIMVGEIEASDSEHAVTALTVLNDNYFMLPDGTMSETGLIEHIAQSCSALVGVNWSESSDCSEHSESKSAPVGLIGEVKRFECMRRPRAGERILSDIEFGLTFGNVTIATGESRVGDEIIAKAQLKIFVQE